MIRHDGETEPRHRAGDREALIGKAEPFRTSGRQRRDALLRTSSVISKHVILKEAFAQATLKPIDHQTQCGSPQLHCVVERNKSP
jgi:hypothetical protein